MTSEATAELDDAAAVACLERLAGQAVRSRIDGPAGAMVWRAWGEGPALVLLHGGSGSWTHWVKTIPRFITCRRVIAGDLPGLGDSPMPPAPYSARSLAAIVSDGIDRMVPEGAAFDLVGFSFGGILSGHVALLQQARIRSLTIVGSPPFGLPGQGPANDVRPVPSTLPFADAVALHRRNLALLMLSDPARVDALALRIHHENLRRARLRSRKIARTDTLARALERTRCTLHGIWGRDDITIHPDLDAIRELFLAARPRASFDALDGIGHWAPYEDPDRFNDVLAARLGDGGAASHLPRATNHTSAS